MILQKSNFLDFLRVKFQLKCWKVTAAIPFHPTIHHDFPMSSLTTRQTFWGIQYPAFCWRTQVDCWNPLCVIYCSSFHFFVLLVSTCFPLRFMDDFPFFMANPTVLLKSLLFLGWSPFFWVVNPCKSPCFIDELALVPAQGHLLWSPYLPRPNRLLAAHRAHGDIRTTETCRKTSM